MTYVMLGKHRIECPREYMQALELVNGQQIDNTVVDDLQKLASATLNQSLNVIGNGIDHLRESRAELLAAAKAVYQAVHGDTVEVGPLWSRLHAAIAAIEEQTP